MPLISCMLALLLKGVTHLLCCNLQAAPPLGSLLCLTQAELIQLFPSAPPPYGIHHARAASCTLGVPQIACALFNEMQMLRLCFLPQ